MLYNPGKQTITSGTLFQAPQSRIKNQALFLNTLAVPPADAVPPPPTPVVAVVPFPAGTFFAAPPPPVTPFLIAPITVRLPDAACCCCCCEGGGFGWAPGGAVMGRFRITVEALSSLDSLAPLALRAVRVAGLDADDGGLPAAAETVAPRLRRAAAAADADADADAVVAVVLVPLSVLRAADDGAVGGRVVDRPPSTILLSMLVAATALPGVGVGRAMPDLAGVAAVRGANLEFEVVGERTCAGLRATSAPAVLARIFFWGVWTWFSLSPPEISWLSRLLA